MNRNMHAVSFNLLPADWRAVLTPRLGADETVRTYAETLIQCRAERVPASVVSISAIPAISAFQKANQSKRSTTRRHASGQHQTVWLGHLNSEISTYVSSFLWPSRSTTRRRVAEQLAHKEAHRAKATTQVSNALSTSANLCSSSSLCPLLPSVPTVFNKTLNRRKRREQRQRQTELWSRLSFALHSIRADLLSSYRTKAEGKLVVLVGANQPS